MKMGILENVLVSSKRFHVLKMGPRTQEEKGNSLHQVMAHLTISQVLDQLSYKPPKESQMSRTLVDLDDLLDDSPQA